MDTCGSERVPTQAEPFLKRLLSRREMRWIGEIAVYFGRLWDKEQGILRFQIWEANGSQAMGSRFLKDRWAGRRVEFTVHENPNLLAGFVVKQGSAVWDYSVEGQLGALSEQFGILEEERLA